MWKLFCQISVFNQKYCFHHKWRNIFSSSFLNRTCNKNIYCWPVMRSCKLDYFAHNFSAVLWRTAANVESSALNCNLHCSLTNLHTSCNLFDMNIPEHDDEDMSEVNSLSDILEFENIFNGKLENEIYEFLTSRAVSFHEGDSGFILPCPSCSHHDHDMKGQELFVDKDTGDFACPWCYQEGNWEDLATLLELKDDCLTSSQLLSYLSATEPLEDKHSSLLQYSPLSEVSIDTLKKFSATLTEDGLRMVMPIRKMDGDIVGFLSISLLHPVSQVICRYLHGEMVQMSSWSLIGGKQIMIVPDVCDVLRLAELGVSAVSYPYGDVQSTDDWLHSDIKKVILWLGSKSPSSNLMSFLHRKNVSVACVRPQETIKPVYSLSQADVYAALSNTIEVQPHIIMSFENLKKKIYYRLINKDEVYGVQWSRFSELNRILLGHRKGELTVMTGLTGTGKTTLVSEYSLDLCMQGVTTLWGSFEVSVVRLCEIMLQQFCGCSLPTDSTSFNALASQFSTLPVYFLNFHSQQNIQDVLKAVTEAVVVYGVTHVVIDNLQFMLGVQGVSCQWVEQDKAVSAFRNFATKNNCHVTLIVHPRKLNSEEILNINSISGGARVTQEADNVLILQVKDGQTLNATKKALQVVKNRYGGQLGVVPLHFHAESLTLSSVFHKKKPGIKDKTANHQDGTIPRNCEDVTFEVTKLYGGESEDHENISNVECHSHCKSPYFQSTNSLSIEKIADVNELQKDFKSVNGSNILGKNIRQKAVLRKSPHSEEN